MAQNVQVLAKIVSDVATGLNGSEYLVLPTVDANYLNWENVLSGEGSLHFANFIHHKAGISSGAPKYN